MHPTQSGPFLALITPLSQAPAEPPLGIWGLTDPRPSHPIAGWDPSTGTWPKPPQPPLVIWVPVHPRPTHPIAGWEPKQWHIPSRWWWSAATWHLVPSDPRPTVPIAEPPWGWGNPAPPITLPPDPIPPDERPIEWKYAWTAETGWVVFGIPTGPVPTPSAATRASRK